MTGSIPGGGRSAERARPARLSPATTCACPGPSWRACRALGVGICAGVRQTRQGSVSCGSAGSPGRTGDPGPHRMRRQSHLSQRTAIERWAMAVWLVRAIDGPRPARGQQRRRSTTWVRMSGGCPMSSGLRRLRITSRMRTTEPLRFCPDRAGNSRAQTASFLVRALDLEPALPAGFGDTGGSVHRAAIDSLWAAGITAGCQTSPPLYCHARAVSRAEMATFLARALGLD